MKHLKLFKTVQDKEAWKNGENYITPNVIYINENDVVEYNSNHLSALSLQTFTAYPEVANKIMNIFNKYSSNYENDAVMSIIIDGNFNYNGINYVPGCASIGFTDSDNFVDFNVSTEDLNYLQSISFVDTAGNIHKPHEILIDILDKTLTFNIYKGNTNIGDFSEVIRTFVMHLEYLDKNSNILIGYITDSQDFDPNAPEMPEPV